MSQNRVLSDIAPYETTWNINTLNVAQRPVRWTLKYTLECIFLRMKNTEIQNLCCNQLPSGGGGRTCVLTYPALSGFNFI